MDTSEEYIKMCDCPEIQDKWKEYGDDGSFFQITEHEEQCPKCVDMITSQKDAYCSYCGSKNDTRNKQIYFL